MRIHDIIETAVATLTAPNIYLVAGLDGDLNQQAGVNDIGTKFLISLEQARGRGTVGNTLDITYSVEMLILVKSGLDERGDQRVSYTTPCEDQMKLLVQAIANQPDVFDSDNAVTNWSWDEVKNALDTNLDGVTVSLDVQVKQETICLEKA